MIRPAINSTLFFLGLVAALSVYAESPLSGVWKHSGKDAWLEFNFDSGLGVATVFRHEGKANANGLVVLKNIQISPDSPDLWTGMMYAADIDDFIAAEIAMPQIDHLMITIEHQGQTEVLTLNRHPAP